ncbi:hypothetical protein CEXT_784381 [Caerostris extrusa]|uniref:Uncharacterized protein n=1 Tax=Caerostris extrusa TaxID=172846 RepID=A0AAV4R178_CAEEX|nr:hypothetical protein CEXT_784381 [Caerostris extrusa]
MKSNNCNHEHKGVPAGGTGINKRPPEVREGVGLHHQFPQQRFSQGREIVCRAFSRLNPRPRTRRLGYSVVISQLPGGSTEKKRKASKTMEQIGMADAEILCEVCNEFFLFWDDIMARRRRISIKARYLFRACA